MSLLEDMGRQEIGSHEASGYQPYQVLTKTARQARAQHAGPSSRAAEHSDDESSEEVCAPDSIRQIVEKLDWTQLCLGNSCQLYC